MYRCIYPHIYVNICLVDTRQRHHNDRVRSNSPSYLIFIIIPENGGRNFSYFTLLLLLLLLLPVIIIVAVGMQFVHQEPQTHGMSYTYRYMYIVQK